MTEIDRDKFASLVAEMSPLSLDQVEALFGPITATNKLACWRFLQMRPAQQKAVWQAHLRIKPLAPEVRVETVR